MMMLGLTRLENEQKSGTKRCENAGENRILITRCAFCFCFLAVKCSGEVQKCNDFPAQLITALACRSSGRRRNFLGSQEKKEGRRQPCCLSICSHAPATPEPTQFLFDHPPPKTCFPQQRPLSFHYKLAF